MSHPTHRKRIQFHHRKEEIELATTTAATTTTTTAATATTATVGFDGCEEQNDDLYSAPSTSIYDDDDDDESTNFPATENSEQFVHSLDTFMKTPHQQHQQHQHDVDEPTDESKSLVNYEKLVDIRHDMQMQDLARRKDFIIKYATAIATCGAVKI